VLTVLVYMYYTVHKHQNDVNKITLVLKQAYCTFRLVLKIVTRSRELLSQNSEWLDGPGFKSRRGRNFSHTTRPDLRPTQLPLQWVVGLSAGKAAGAWC
jgi:hypothetical protein